MKISKRPLGMTVIINYLNCLLLFSHLSFLLFYNLSCGYVAPQHKFLDHNIYAYNIFYCNFSTSCPANLQAVPLSSWGFDRFSLFLFIFNIDSLFALFNVIGILNNCFSSTFGSLRRRFSIPYCL
mmetsp:Transcript_10385/g.14301  ORF Transcript_10385/g.14301 Transcript_10385/m.14301 type:complete len:125 (+) Transcript_10385:1731-2105(+)